MRSTISVDIQVHQLASLGKSGMELAVFIQENCVSQTKSQHDHQECLGKNSRVGSIYWLDNGKGAHPTGSY